MPFGEHIILGDWGTSHLRLWLLSRDGDVLDSVTSDHGAGRVSGNGAKRIFLDITSNWRHSCAISHAVLCGMVGRKGGWVEAPYLPLEKSADLAQHLVRISADTMQVFIVPGVMSPSRDDVMRGEETQIFGLTQVTPGYSGTVCLPGTHSKWCDLSGGLISRFHTEMTGELFALLSEQSMLKESCDRGYDEAAFDSGVALGLRDAAAFSHLFAFRANWLLNGADRIDGYSKLSGLLIGSEIARVQARTTSPKINLIGTSHLTTCYQRALQRADFDVSVHSGDDLVIRGLTQVAHSLMATTCATAVGAMHQDARGNKV